MAGIGREFQMAATPSLVPKGKGLRGSRFSNLSFTEERLLGIALSLSDTLLSIALRTSSRVRGASKTKMACSASAAVERNDCESEPDQFGTIAAPALRAVVVISRQAETERSRSAPSLLFLSEVSSVADGFDRCFGTVPWVAEYS